jgi:hypothetical protein
MCIELKIKAKHLALEPAIIKREEAKLKRRIKYHRSDDKTSAISLTWKLHSLTNHRKTVVRNESRATHLARTYLAGKPYSYAESSSRRTEWGHECFFSMVIVPRIVAMVQRYGTGDQKKVDNKTIIEWAKLPK